MGRLTTEVCLLRGYRLKQYFYIELAQIFPIAELLYMSSLKFLHQVMVLDYYTCRGVCCSRVQCQLPQDWEEVLQGPGHWRRGSQSEYVGNWQAKCDTGMLNMLTSRNYKHMWTFSPRASFVFVLAIIILSQHAKDPQSGLPVPRDFKEAEKFLLCYFH